LSLPAELFALYNLQGGRLYIRLGNSTCEAAEAAINQLEGGAGSVVYGSGMAAISAALMSFLKSGDHVVCSRGVIVTRQFS